MGKGKFYGISVGPGAPELLTLKAKRVVETCSVIATPVTLSGNMLAMDILNRVVDISEKNLYR